MKYNDSNAKDLIGKKFRVSGNDIRIYTINKIINDDKSYSVSSYNTCGELTAGNWWISTIVNNINNGSWILYEKPQCKVCE
jgi:hypothetical protein